MAKIELHTKLLLAIASILFISATVSAQVEICDKNLEIIDVIKNNLYEQNTNARANIKNNQLE